jgi:hypothetical protein
MSAQNSAEKLVGQHSIQALDLLDTLFRTSEATSPAHKGGVFYKPESQNGSTTWVTELTNKNIVINLTLVQQSICKRKKQGNKN